MADCGAYTLSEVVDKYFIDRMISKKKYYAAYLNMAQDEWRQFFRNTLWSVQSRWLPMKLGSPYNYIDVPSGISRLLSVSVKDRCDLIQPLFVNNQLNVVDLPAERKCGCTADCGCGGVCESANSMTYTTTFLFTYGGVDYYQKCWSELCPNGDILEYCETPTKQYNNTSGDGGDYFDEDYNDDYLIGTPPFSDVTIVTVKSQKKICKLEVAPCGCPVETEENAALLNENCGCSVQFGCSIRRRRCKQYFENIDNNYFGEVKLSECGTKVYYKPSPYWKRVSDVEFPEFLLVSYQTNGDLPDSEIMVPDFAVNAIKSGIHYRSTRFNVAHPQVVRDDSWYQYQKDCAEVVKFCNPISLIDLGAVQDIQVRW